MAQNVIESNILICGSSRVGKTSLINAICQKELSKSNASLSSDTKNIERYSAQTVIDGVTYETNFWDTPGIESWNENDVRNYMALLIEKTHPICMIYCASPGSFAVLDHVAWMVSECYQKNIFSALICTNMWSGRNRQVVVDEFCKLLHKIHPEIEPKKEDGIIYYDRVALVTMVNSVELVDEDFDVRKPPSGINELIFGIAKCLNRDFMIAWFRAVSNNQSFWTTMSSRLSGLLKIPYEKFNTFFEHAGNFLNSILDYIDDDDDYPIYSSRLRNTTVEEDPKVSSSLDIFQDAEMIEMPSLPKTKALLFKFNSSDMAAQFKNALIQLGASTVRDNPSDTSDESTFSCIAKFQDDERLQAIYDIWQAINYAEVKCNIIEDSSTD